MTWLLEILSRPGECYDLAPGLGSFFSSSGCGTPNDSNTSAQPDSGLWRKPKARWASAHAPARPDDETLEVLRKVNPREQRSAFTPWGLTCSEGRARQCVTKCNNCTARQMAFVTAKELLVLRKRKTVFWLSECGQLKETYNSMNQNIITTESSQRGEGGYSKTYSSSVAQPYEPHAPPNSMAITWILRGLWSGTTLLRFESKWEARHARPLEHTSVKRCVGSCLLNWWMSIPTASYSNLAVE